MNLRYVLIKCADKSFKGIDQLRKMQELPDKFNLAEYIREHNIGNAYDKPKYAQKQSMEELLKMPKDPIREKISRYNVLKETILQQIAPFCINLSCYEQEPNNDLSKYYFDCIIEATDKALSKPLTELEKVFEQNNCDYDILLAAALAIRYGIDKGILKVEEQQNS